MPRPALLPMLLAALTPLALASDLRPAPLDPTTLTRPAVATTDPCPTWSEAPGFQVARGEASGHNPATALSLARQDAFDQLQDLVCKGIETSPRCLAARRGIVPYGCGQVDRKTHAACASVAIAEADLHSFDRDLAALDQDLGALAVAVRQAAGGGPIDVLTPRWIASGCTADEVGAQLQNSLLTHLPGARLGDGPDAAQVRLRLSRDAARVTVSAAIRAGSDWTALTPVVFPVDLFSLASDPGGRCYTDTALGLDEGHRSGADHLEVDLSAEGEGGLFCAGEQVHPRIALSAPARVRVYTVEGDGQGFQVWPYRPEDDRVYTPESPPSLPAFTGLPTWDGSDTRLVAVATPPDVPAPIPALCRLSRPLNPGALAAGAAVDTAGFHVLAAGQRLCLSRGAEARAAAAREDAERVLSTLSDCANP